MDDFKKHFLSKVDKTETCWNWTDALRNGYGAIRIKRKTFIAHRVSYELFVGEIPNNMCVCHKCDNPKCVNPDHLFIGTHSDNMKDAYNKGRLCIPIGERLKKGHKNNRVLTNEQIIDVKKLISSGRISLVKISKLLKIKYQTIRDISCGRTYINV